MAPPSRLPTSRPDCHIIWWTLSSQRRRTASRTMWRRPRSRLAKFGREAAKFCSWAAHPCTSKPCFAGCSTGRPGDVPFREQIMAEAAAVGTEALHDRLSLVDPLSAAKLHRNDLPQSSRPLEVYRVTGQPISHQQLQFDEGLAAESCRVFVFGPGRCFINGSTIASRESSTRAWWQKFMSYYVNTAI